MHFAAAYRNALNRMSPHICLSPSRCHAPVLRKPSPFPRPTLNSASTMWTRSAILVRQLPGKPIGEGDVHSRWCRQLNPVELRVMRALFTKRCKNGRIGRFQFRLPVDIPRPDLVTKNAIRRAVDVNRPVTSLMRSCCGAGRASTPRHRGLTSPARLVT